MTKASRISSRKDAASAPISSAVECTSVTLRLMTLMRFRRSEYAEYDSQSQRRPVEVAQSDDPRLLFRPFRAPRYFYIWIPRALPWAIFLRPFGPTTLRSVDGPSPTC